LSQDARMTITIATLLVIVLLVIKFFIKPVMVKAGQDNQDYYSGLYKWIYESVTGIKEIKVANKENYFINGYADCGAGYVNAVQKYNLYNSTPRLLIETIAIAGMVGYMLVVMLNGTSLTSLLPQMTVLAAAAARLLPSANRINNYLTSIAYFEPFLDNVSDNLQMEIHDESISYDSEKYREKSEVTKLPVKKTITLSDITYKYPGTDKLILDGASMEIPVGKSVGIVGTSGAGKTTIVDVLLGLLIPEKGVIMADGVDVNTNYRGWLKNIGYIPQTIFMTDSTIRKNVAFGVPDDEIDDNKVWQALKEAALDEFVKELPEGLDTQIGERGIRLSGGQRQRIGIARALFEDPEVLVLDEATSALDNDTEAAIMDSINRLHGRKTLVIIAHRLQTIEKCDMIYNIGEGKATLK
ncbi:MAG: ABC transporter ATP-binding protein, partial [Lachnospiraceae bacterium]|nr:ABC transporter ATP-binding protein [Lachnospiraceae bacterium]